MVGQDVRQILLNANGDPGRFARFALPVVADTIPNQPGPLAGVLAGMEWAMAHAPDVEDLITVPTDTPFLPTDLVDRLLQEREAADAELACAASAGRVHPVCGLWPVRLAPVLRNALVTEGHRRVDRWTAQFRLVQVAFSEHPVDPFLNINTPGDLVMAAELVGH
jgi:molybdopterin-guanine dinucleotide biosynthesis protein A